MNNSVTSDTSNSAIFEASEVLWQIINSVYDLLSNTSTPYKILPEIFTLLVEQFHIPSGLMIIQGDQASNSLISEHKIPDISNYPDLLDTAILRARNYNPQNEQTHSIYIIDQVYSILPIRTPTSFQGAFLVPKSYLSEPMQLALLHLLKPVAKALENFHSISASTPDSAELVALDLLHSAENVHFDIGASEDIILSGLLDIFHSDAVIFYFLDRDDPSLILKKVLTKEGEWLAPESHKLTEGLVFECVKTCIVIDNKEEGIPALNQPVDGIDNVFVDKAVYSPLVSQGQVLGVIGIINADRVIDPADRNRILLSLSASLANSIHSLRLIDQLRIANADLEASRWELLNSRNTLRALFDSIPSSIYIVDRDYTLVAINKSRAIRTSEVPNKLIGKKCYAVLYQKADPCQGCRTMETLMNGQNTIRTRREWVNDNDPQTEWEISTYPIYDKGGTPLQAILLEQDVTEKRRLEASLVQSEKLAAVGQLAAGVAHEINNPLAAIIANAQIIQRSPIVDDDIIESAKLIEMAGTRASQVVRNLLGFARKEKYDFSATNLNETIENSLALLQHEIITRSINMLLDLQPDMPPIIASRDHLQGVWVNIIVNAMDSVERGDGKIRISSRYTNNEFRVSIVDNGKGIPPEYINRIFEPFYTTKSPGKGTGLGLSVCHRVIKQHGGQILVDSQIGIGTRFTIVLPVNT